MKRTSAIVAIGALTMALAFGGCAGRQGPQTPPPPPPLDPAGVATAATPPDGDNWVVPDYFWVQVVARSAAELFEDDPFGPVLVARAIVAADPAGAEPDCPEIVADARRALMVPRRTDADPAAFPVLVCEARVPSTAATVTIGGQPLGFSPRDLGPHLARVALLGDTGCRGTEDNPCPLDGSKKASKWGLPLVVDGIAQRAADGRFEPTLGIHVGDFLYRQLPELTGCGPGELCCAEGKACDVWKGWRMDWFDPARPILPRMPWLMARGNHEACTADPRVEGGDGWFLFLSPVTPCLDPGDELPGCSQPVALRTCASMDSQTPLPWAVDLALPAGVPGGSVRAVVLDTSGAKDPKPPRLPDPGVAAAYLPLLRQVTALAGGAERSLLVTHIPIYALREYDADLDLFRSVNRGLQGSLMGLSTPLPTSLELALVGHRHVVQSANVTQTRAGARPAPPHLVMGASGVDLSGKKLARKLADDDGQYAVTTRAGVSDDPRVGLAGWLGRFHAWAELTPAATETGWAANIVDAGGDDAAACTVSPSPAEAAWPTALACAAAAE